VIRVSNLGNQAYLKHIANGIPNLSATVFFFRIDQRMAVEFHSSPKGGAIKQLNPNNGDLILKETVVVLVNCRIRHCQKSSIFYSNLDITYLYSEMG
jgi:hypothetical protein